MSRRANIPNLELKLNLSPPRAIPQVVGSPNTSVSSSEMSPQSSCVSSELSPKQRNSSIMRYSSSPEETTSMILVGCPRCLMYVMLSEVNPMCPKCKSTVLLDFLNEDHHNSKKNRN